MAKRSVPALGKREAMDLLFNNGYYLKNSKHLIFCREGSRSIQIPHGGGKNKDLGDNLSGKIIKAVLEQQALEGGNSKERRL